MVFDDDAMLTFPAAAKIVLCAIFVSLCPKVSAAQIKRLGRQPIILIILDRFLVLVLVLLLLLLLLCCACFAGNNMSN